MRGIPVGVRARSALPRALRVVVVGLSALGLLTLAACTSGSATASKSAPGSSIAPVTPVTPASSLPASERPATTPVAPPKRGNISQHVPSGSVSTRSPVSMGKSASFSNTLRARALSAIEFRAKATRPGEISGPAVRVTVQIDNESRSTASLAGVAVTCHDAAGTPLVAMESSPVQPFATTVPAHASAKGVYVFELAKGWHNPLTFVLTNAATRSAVQFNGRVS
jgi:hypothetical protein